MPKTESKNSAKPKAPNKPLVLCGSKGISVAGESIFRVQSSSRVFVSGDRKTSPPIPPPEVDNFLQLIKGEKIGATYRIVGIMDGKSLKIDRAPTRNGENLNWRIVVNGASQICKCCCGKIRADNDTGACGRTPQCRRERNRVHFKKSYYANVAKSRDREKRYRNRNKAHMRQLANMRYQKRKRTCRPTRSRITPKEFAKLAGLERDVVYYYTKHIHKAIATRESPEGRTIQTWPANPTRTQSYLCSMEHALKLKDWYETEPGAIGPDAPLIPAWKAAEDYDCPRPTINAWLKHCPPLDKPLRTVKKKGHRADGRIRHSLKHVFREEIEAAIARGNGRSRQKDPATGRFVKTTARIKGSAGNGQATAVTEPAPPAGADGALRHAAGKVAKFIRNHPGEGSKQIARGVTMNASTVRHIINEELKPRGFRREGKTYYPPTK